ncbi:MAG: DUF6179 domain-containing protein [Erysipelotrichaceae bacterium]|nr:DUF6179 domain-containing protein [Erysipelotrichaceae bacterium]
MLKGHNKNREYLKRSRAIYSRLMKNLFKNPDRYYNSTISDGIRAFFKLYDYRYLTHDYIITVYYPLMILRNGMMGAQFICNYLYCIETENIFLNRFDSEDVSSLLESLKEDYIDIPFNLAECVFVNWPFDFKSEKQIIEQYEKLSKEDLLTELRHKLNISHLSYR